jgi:hypothetical protein
VMVCSRGAPTRCCWAAGEGTVRTCSAAACCCWIAKELTGCPRGAATRCYRDAAGIPLCSCRSTRSCSRDMAGVIVRSDPESELPACVATLAAVRVVVRSDVESTSGSAAEYPVCSVAISGLSPVPSTGCLALAARAGTLGKGIFGGGCRGGGNEGSTYIGVGSEGDGRQ